MYVSFFGLKLSDCSVDSKLLLTAGADNSLRLWDVTNGKQLYIWNTQSPVRSVHFNEGCTQALFITDATMGQISTIHIIDIAKDVSSRMYLMAMDI